MNSVIPRNQEYKNNATVFESITETVDTNTGELLEFSQTIKGKADKEPDFMKLYINTMLTFQGIRNVPADMLIAVCEEIKGYNNDEVTPLIFEATKLTKTRIANKLNIKIDMVNKYIKKLNDSGILVKINDIRGAYTINPWVLARGEWKNISKLRTHFDFINDEWEVDAIISNSIKK